MGTTRITEFVHEARVYNTHEHMVGEEVFLKEKPDVLRTIFHNYMWGDLCGAGTSRESVEVLMDASNPDIGKRFGGIKKAWEAVKLTGYGEVVSMGARHFHGIEDLNEESLIRAQAALPEQWNKGDRYRLLKEEGKYDSIQIDDFEKTTLPDEGEGDFFLKDLSWFNLSSGILELEKLQQATGIEVRSMESFRETLGKLFALYGPTAIAVKTPHAYNRTLKWVKRSDSEVSPLLEKAIADESKLTGDERVCLGDWCLARGVELSIQHHIPFKIHTGYKAGYGFMDIREVSPALLNSLLLEYPEARFVLMHTGYPFAEETLGIAKHFPNVWIDLCWAWALNPWSTSQFVRAFIQSVPINKLFGYGGDVFFPHHSVAMGLQTRKYLARTLDAGVADKDFSEKDGLRIAKCFLQENQKQFFDYAGVREANREWLAQARP